MSQPRKINVLDVRSCRGGGGGPEKTILFSALETDREHFNMSVAYLKSKDDPEFDLHERAQKLGVESFYTIDESFKFDIGAMRRVLKLLREKNIDVYHGHCYKSDLYGLILSRFHKMKLVTTAHGPLASFKFFWASKNWRVRYLYDQIDLRLLKHYDLVLMVSDTMREIISRYGVDPQRMMWIRNAIDSKYFQRSGAPDAAFRAELGIPPGATVVGAVGRLNGEKDYPNMLRAAQILLKQRPDLYFVIAGKGELEPELKALAAELGVAQRVIFMGHFHDVRKVFELMDLYVLSSTREGLPNTVLEAMAMGVPIVSTDVDGVKEAVSDQREAFLVPAQDSVKLAEGIARMLDDRVLRERLARDARAKVETDFSFAHRTRTIENLYRKLMSA
ncbi:MAG TPA: glycosyltransferase [Steroidobacteraceae bacterium]|nr:glycosyltransferase [Steroidobacteraceae bacterium]